MGNLIRFELKKMLRRRVALVANVGVLVMLAGIMALNVVQNRTTNNLSETLTGTAAIAQRRAEAQAYAGTLTVERIVEDVTGYRARVLEQVDAEELLAMSNMRSYEYMVDTYGSEYVASLYDSYWSYLMQPFRVTGEEPYQTAVRVTDDELRDFYGAVAGLTQAELDDGQSGSWEFSDAERAYWTDMQARVGTPLVYGYADGWANIIDCAAFLSFAMLAICITLAPMFASEYQTGADAVLLATRYGRSRLVAAKVLASFAYATAYFAVGAAIVAGVSVVFYGADGFGLPVQVIHIASPYPLTAGAAALVSLGLMYLAMLGVAAITLLMSSRTRSTMSVLVVDVVLVFLTGMVPTGGNGFLTHLMGLFPMNFSNFSNQFSALMDYPLGPVVIDLIGMVTIVCLLLTIAGVPAAAASFRRHQVG